MAPAYKLSYFNGRGLTEPIRFLFKYGNVDFEDFRFEQADWPALKEKTPFGQVPVLEHNGKVIGQSIAIARYVGKLVKLAGKDDWENLEIDSIVETYNDLRQKVAQAHFYEKDETKKAQLKADLAKDTFPFYLQRFEDRVKQNKGFLALDRLTWADLYVVALSPLLDLVTGSDALAPYPNLTALREKVLAIPEIKKWVAERPASDF